MSIKFAQIVARVLNQRKKYEQLMNKNKLNNNSFSSLDKANNKDASKIYCSGDMLHSVQMAKIFVDSKTFVDMPTKRGYQHVVDNFAKLGADVKREDLELFLRENFYAAGEDIIHVRPRDWSACPPFIANVREQPFVELAHFLNNKWNDLFKQQVNSRICSSCLSSILDSHHPFVVPGGRFMEYYYWDTYWIIHGLLSCHMFESARDLICNFLGLIKRIGFVPNGSRIYYLNRSQPPLLTQMVDIYVEKTGDVEFLKHALSYLDLEYEFWMRERVRTVHSQRSSHHIYRLNLYDAKSSQPRPESYKEDYINARESGREHKHYYSNILSATESGWDFSSRWFSDPMDIKTIQITQILPVDLNALMFRNERTLSKFHRRLKSARQVIAMYEEAMRAREQALNDIFWSDELKTWADFNYVTGKLNTSYTYISDLAPLCAGVRPQARVDDILSRYSSLLMDYKSGIPASNIFSQHQWDFPNLWAPYHLDIVQYLLSENRNEMALDIAQRFVNTVYIGWLKSDKKMIFEKYSVNDIGSYGGGGEYAVQEGFGWTNGVAIKFLDMFGDRLKVLSNNNKGNDYDKNKSNKSF